MDDTRKRTRKTQATAVPQPAAKKPAGGAARTRKTTGARPALAAAAPSLLERHDMVRVAAYFRAERRGFQPGCEWDAWLAAEAEVAVLSGAPPAPQAKARARKPRAG